MEGHQRDRPRLIVQPRAPQQVPLPANGQVLQQLRQGGVKDRHMEQPLDRLLLRAAQGGRPAPQQPVRTLPPERGQELQGQLSPLLQAGHLGIKAHQAVDPLLCCPVRPGPGLLRRLGEVGGAVPAQGQGAPQGQAVSRLQEVSQEAEPAPYPPVRQKVVPSGHHTGDAVPAQALLQKVQLTAGAAEHREILKAPGPLRSPALPLGLQHIHAAHLAGHLLGHKDGLRKVALGLQDPHRSPGGALRLQHPRRTGISVDDRQGRSQDLRGGAVIPGQRDPLQVWEILLQPGKAGRFGPPEAIDGLVRVPDGEETLPLPAPGHQQVILHRVTVLELVYQQMAEGPLQPGGGPSLPPKGQGLQQQVVVVQQAQGLQLGAVVPAELLRNVGLPAVLPAGDPFQQLSRRTAALVGGEDRFRRRQGLVGSRQPGPLGPLGENVQTDAVEGAHRDAVGRPLAPQKGLQPGPELPRRPVGEGDRRDLSRLYAPLPDQPGRPGRQGAGLACSGARRHADRPRGRGDGCRLGRIQGLSPLLF